jgi:hypothetical protein
MRPDSGRDLAPFWSVIKANITPAGRPFEHEFSAWYSREHVPEWVAKPGFRWGRRLRRVPADGQIGAAEHDYLAVYGIDTIDAFNDALAGGPPWGPWQPHIGEYVTDWERTYYRLTDVIEAPARGRFWGLMKVDLAPEADADAFHRWYAETHLPEIAAAPGIERACRLTVEPDANDLGPRRQQYWAVYELQAPQALVAARQARFDRGIAAWDGIWGDAVRNVQLAFYELIFEIDHTRATAETAQRKGVA